MARCDKARRGLDTSGIIRCCGTVGYGLASPGTVGSGTVGRGMDISGIIDVKVWPEGVWLGVARRCLAVRVREWSVWVWQGFLGIIDVKVRRVMASFGRACFNTARRAQAWQGFSIRAIMEVTWLGLVWLGVA